VIDQKFILIGAALSLYGGVSYVISTLRGRTKPNRVTWFLWATVPIIAFSAQLSEGIRWQALLTFVAGFNPLMIFLASFINKKSYWKITRLDIICGAVSLLAIILWAISGKGTVAIILSIVADLLAGVPTLVKAYRLPETENYRVFLFGAINATITLLTIKHLSIANSAFALYILGICIALVALIRFRLGAKIRFS
jgi:hypothetical protein